MLARDVIVGDWIIRTGVASASNGLFVDNTFVTFPVKLLAITDYHYMIWSPDRYLGMRQSNSVQGLSQMYGETAQQAQRTSDYLYGATALIPCDHYSDWVRADKKIVEWIGKIVGLEMFERLEMI